MPECSEPSSQGETPVPLEAVLRTEELLRRGGRPVDHEAENRALTALVEAMADPSAAILQRLADTALELCEADSAGISILDEEGDVFRWQATAGRWAPLSGSTLPRHGSPCGTVLDCDRELLMSHPERHYSLPDQLGGPIPEVLLVPFRVAGVVVGTLWVVVQEEGRRFDGEDVRLLNRLGTFAAAAHRLLAAQAAQLQSDRLFRDSEHRFREIVDALPAAVYTTDAAGRITHFNPAAVEFSGRVPQLGSDHWCTTWKLYRPDGTPLPHDQCPMAIALREGRPIRGAEAIAERPDGERRRFEPYPTPLRDEQGRVVGGVNMLVDVTERHRTLEALRQSEAKFHDMADHISQLAWMADGEGEIFWYNRRWFQYTGTTLEQMYGWGWTAVHHPDHVERVVEKVRRHWQSGEPWEDTFPLRGQDGQYRWFLSRAVPIRDEQGKVLRWFGTNTDVTEQLAAEEALKEADRRKDEFLAMLAHELRNPLAAISSGIQLFCMPGAPERPEWVAEMMSRQVEHLTCLINDLMDISRITRGKIQLHKETLELSPLIDQAVAAVRELYSERRHELSVTVPAEPIWMEADATRLEQILVNLLTNAAKYTEPGGRVVLSVQQEPHQVTICVRDNGIGLAPPMLSQVFELFTQIDASIDRSQGGLGIGLTLVKTLTEMHGGSITAASEGLGKGSQFTVRLPVADPVAAASEASEVETLPGGRGRRVLVVDDNQDAALLLSHLLQEAGHDVAMVHDGPAALLAVQSHRPEAVLLDIGLPEMDGYQVAARLREDHPLDEVLLIAVSGYGHEEVRQRCQAAGFDHHLIKPVDHHRLLSLLDPTAKSV